MKKVLLSLLSLCTFYAAAAQTNVSGTINSNTTWTAAGGPYIVTSNIAVGAGVTLTVEAGTVVKFNDNISMYVYGTLNATDATFTASNASPSAGITGEIKVGLTSGDVNGTANFTNSQFLYFKIINIENGSASFTGCSFASFSQYGIHAYGDAQLIIDGGSISSIGTSGDYNTLRIAGTADASITNFTVTGDNNSSEVAFFDSATGTLSGLNVQGSGGRGLDLHSNGAISVTDCNLNNNLYPIILQRAGVPLTFSGANDFTNNTYDVVYVNFYQFNANTILNDPGIPYYFPSGIQVNTEIALNIASGNILKVQPGNWVTVYGELTASAQVGEKIHFTSWYDDNLGGDSNNDANNTAPTSGKWQGIHFYSSSNDASILKRVEVRWVQSYGAVNLTDASPTVDSCEFKNAYYGAAFNNDSNPVFTNNVIAASESTPVAMSFEADPVFEDNQFSTSDNVYDAIGLLGGTLTADANITQRDFTDVPNVTYVMLNNITVPYGRTLTIDAGVVIKSLNGYNFDIKGKLLVNGTAEEKVMFTSVNDDNFGNPLDTRNDGTSQTPAAGNFGGIFFDVTSDPTSTIDYASVRFAKFGANYQATIIGLYYDAAIAINSASPTITNTEIFLTTNGIDIRGNSSPVISNNKITSTSYAPYRIAIQSTPEIGTNEYASLGWKAITVLPEVVNYSATLSKRNIAGLFDNTTYVITDLYISQGANVTLDSGLIVKMPQHKNIDVHGGLHIRGTADARVLFTSIADDNAGASGVATDNDTEGNGNATTPANIKWGTIRFRPTSDDAFSRIEYADFHFGGISDAAITLESASATISQVNVKFGSNYGLWFNGNSQPDVSDVFIQSCGSDPLAMSFFSDPVFTNITFDANGSNGIRLLDTEIGANATLKKRDVAGITNIAYVTTGFLIHSAATLTINPGVVMKFPNGSIGVGDGAINAIGTPSEKVIFTSINDDSRGGDTNNNGNNTPPGAGNWGGIDTRASSKQTILQNCEFRYGSNGFYYRYYNDAPYDGFIRSSDNNMIVENCVIQFTNNYAFGIYGTSTASIINNTIQNVANTAVEMDMFANPTFTGNTLENVGKIAILIRPETYSQSATFPFRSFAGYDSITYMFPSRFYVATGTTITIPAGMHIKLMHSDLLADVSGRLVVAGTADDPVVVTVMMDDNYGRPKDTEQNGPPTYTPGNSSAVIQFNNISDDASTVNYLHARYMNTHISMTSASPTITNCTFEYGAYGLGLSGSSEPVIDNNKFKDLTRTPFATSILSFPSSMNGNEIVGTTWKAIRINEETLTQDTTLVKRSFGGINNIPYYFEGYGVGPGVTLTIKPGVILKFAQRQNWPYDYGYLSVSGALKAIGGPDADSTIVITSIEDDFYGGDTNSNGPQTATTNSFQGLFFNNESSDGLCELEYVIVRRSNYHGLTLNSASPTIRNTSIRNNGYNGLYLTGASNPTLEGNDFIENGYHNPTSYFGVNNTGSFTVDATGSWWGANSGPYHATNNPTGTGQRVSDNVTFDPWTSDRSLRPITGDVSLNGAVTAFDAAVTLQAVASIVTLNERQELAGDVSGNDAVSAMDASYILQYSAGLIHSFPAESTNKRIDLSNLRAETITQLDDAVLETKDQLIEIPVRLTQATNLFAFDLAVELDEVLELVAIKNGNLGQVNFVSNYDKATGRVYLTFAGMKALENDGTLAILQVKLATHHTTKSELNVNITRVIGNETDVRARSKSSVIRLSDKLIEDMTAAFQVFPNPTIDYIDIKVSAAYEGPAEVVMMDATGKKMLTHRFQEKKGISSERIQFKANKGLYILKVSTAEGMFTEKVNVGQ